MWRDRGPDSADNQIITVADALQSLRTVEAVRRSIATGHTVALQAMQDLC